MKLFGISNRGWRVWGLYNGMFAGIFYFIYEIIGVVLPSHDLLMLQNLILAGIFGGLSAICVFIAETPRSSGEDEEQSGQRNVATEPGQKSRSHSESVDDS